MEHKLAAVLGGLSTSYSLPVDTDSLSRVLGVLGVLHALGRLNVLGMSLTLCVEILPTHTRPLLLSITHTR